ncbi:TPA: lipopolysaccharide biosynthesis protein [Vibrio diabolicus]
MKLISSAIKIGLGIIIAQSITALSIPILTRLYSAEDFALFGYLFSTSSLLGTLAFLRFESFAAKEKTKDIVRRYIPALLYLALFTLPLMFALILFGFYLFPYQTFDDPIDFIVAGLITVMATYSWGGFTLLSIVSSRLGIYKNLATARIGKSIVTVSFQFLLVLANYKFSLFIGEVMGRVFAILFMLNKTKCNLFPSKILFFVFYRKNKEEAKYNFVASLMNSMSLNFFPLFIVYFYSPTLSGGFFLLYKMIGSPLNILTQSLAISYLGNISNYIVNKKFKEIKEAMFKTSLYMFLLCVLILTFLYFLLKYYAGLLIGEGWLGLSSMLLLISPMLLGQVVFSPFSKLLVVLNYARWQLYWDSSRLILVLVAFFIPFILKIDNETSAFNLSLVFFSCLMLFMYIVHFLLSIFVIKRKINE